MYVRFKSTLKTISKCPPARNDTGCTFCLTPSIISTLPSMKSPPFSVSKTAPPMDKLIVYLSGDSRFSQWGKKLESEPGSVMHQLSLLKRGAGIGALYTSINGTHGDKNEFIVYPQGVKVSLNKDEPLDEFFKQVLNDEMVGEEIIKDPVVLICSHEQRDQRCGVIGPMVLEEFQRVPNKAAFVGGCSHVGGHLYAGNVLICRPERVDWYGMVRPEHVQGIIEVSIEDDKVIEELHRGSTCTL